jgi:hypothetical protein
MKQIWRHTWYEVATNIAIGYLVSVVGNWFYLYYTGYALGFWEINGLGLWMTLLSIVRQLVIRRLFEFIRMQHLKRTTHATAKE